MPRSNCARALALHAFALFAGFALACLAVRRLAPFPDVPQVSEKLAALGAGSPRYNAVFVGSSKINSGIVPALFDEAVGARGLAMRSFNLGIEGMGFPENAYLCEEMLARTGGSLRWVFIELSGIRTVLEAGNEHSRRVLYWHDVPRTFLICRSLLAGPAGKSALTPPEVRRLLWRHLRLGCRRFVNLAEGAELVRSRLLPAAARTPGLPNAGFVPMRKELQPAMLPEYRRNLALFAAARTPGDAISDAALRALARRIARAGATAIFVVPPNPYPGRRFLGGGDAATPVLACDDPERFPLLYDPQFRADEIHLTEAGARHFTTTLAALFCDLVEGSERK